MDPVVAVLFAVLLLPAVLVVIAVRRGQQATRRDRAEIAAFVARHRLSGVTTNPISVGGTVDGVPCFVSVDRVGEGKGTRSLLRARLVTSDAATYRRTEGDGGVALLVSRTDTLPVDRVTGLQEVLSGDAAFDAAYRAFATPGGAVPWQNPGVRSAVLSFRGALVRAERSPSECSVALDRYFWRGHLLGRTLALASSLVGPVEAARHAEELAAPLDTSRPLEDRRVGWGIARALAVPLLATVAAFPLSFLPPVHDLVEYVACDGRETLQTVGVTNGRGVTFVCWDHVHEWRGAGGWLFFVGFDVGLVVALVLFALLELAVRLRGR